MKPSILLVDNYDSFTYNLKHALQEAGARVNVRLNDDPRLLEWNRQHDALALSPGPSRPRYSGLSLEVFRINYRQKPILGVCLGMQIINEALGGKTVRAPQAVHGKTAWIRRTGDSRILDGLPRKFRAARYHSLVCAAIPEQLRITARQDQVVMAVEHEHLPVFGVQFHPESFLTEYGQKIIQNFIARIC